MGISRARQSYAVPRRILDCRHPHACEPAGISLWFARQVMFATFLEGEHLVPCPVNFRNRIEGKIYGVNDSLKGLDFTK